VLRRRARRRTVRRRFVRYSRARTGRGEAAVTAWSGARSRVDGGPNLHPRHRGLRRRTRGRCGARSPGGRDPTPHNTHLGRATRGECELRARTTSREEPCRHVDLGGCLPEHSRHSLALREGEAAGVRGWLARSVREYTDRRRARSGGVSPSCSNVVPSRTRHHRRGSIRW